MTWAAVLLALLSACIPAAQPSSSAPILAPSPAEPTGTPLSPVPSAAFTPIQALASATTPTSAPTMPPAVSSLKATVSAELLSCRYGPGAAYLFLYGLRIGANIKLIGRTDGTNWNWAYVDGANKCWVNAKFIQMQGDILSLPIVYPGTARLPVSPYYPPTTVLHTARRGDKVTIDWLDIPLRPGDEEDERMLHYIVEAWHCEGGRFLFEPMATDGTRITLTDDPGCALPSHGRIFVQEKHGFAGPTEIPWPGFN